jgi:Domain of unknown function (DUF5615)
MKFYLDEQVPLVVASFLRSHGVDCLTARDAGNLGLSDEEQLIVAMREGCVLVTFNCADFIQLAHDWQAAGRIHSGILLSKVLPLGELFRRFRYMIVHNQGRDMAGLVLWLASPPKEPGA